MGRPETPSGIVIPGQSVAVASQPFTIWQPNSATLDGVSLIRLTPFCMGTPAISPGWSGSSFQLMTLAALIVAWCLLAIAAIVTASTQRFEGACMYFVAAVVVVGFAIITAIVLAP
jgi:hypothetical protein